MEIGTQSEEKADKDLNMERSIIRIRDVDNAERRYQTTGSIRNVVMEKNNESKMDGAQNK